MCIYRGSYSLYLVSTTPLLFISWLLFEANWFFNYHCATNFSKSKRDDKSRENGGITRRIRNCYIKNERAAVCSKAFAGSSVFTEPSFPCYSRWFFFFPCLLLVISIPTILLVKLIAQSHFNYFFWFNYPTYKFVLWIL